MLDKKKELITLQEDKKNFRYKCMGATVLGLGFFVAAAGAIAYILGGKPGK